MKKTWILDVLLGLAVSLFVGGSYVMQGAFLESLELKAYDARAKFRQSLEPPTDVVLIAIDDDSIARMGRWPWPRTRIAEMLDLLVAAKPKVIGLDILYSEPEVNPAIAELENLKTRYGELLQGRNIVQKKGVDFQNEFSSMAVRLDTDSRLLASLTTAQNVVLPMFFSGGGLLGAKPEELPPALSSAALTARVTRAEAGFQDVEGGKPVYPILPFLKASAGVGHVSIYPDLDGVVRREVPAVKYGASYFPSYALALTARYLGIKPDEILVTPGSSIELGKLKIPLDEQQSMLVTFNGPDHTFRYYSFHEVLNGKVSMDVFKDKIVILGPSAAGIATLYVTPVAQSLPSVEFIANVIENILGQRFLVRPPWAVRLELGLIAFCAFFVMFLLPRLKALGGAIITALLLAAAMGAGGWLFVERGEWIKVIYPCFLLAAGYVVIVTKRFLVTEKGKELVEASAIETNKMLGLSFQGQGMFDLAFEKFRLCPVDDNMKETLYSLALDFERKRQYGKAVNVYKHVSAHDPKYKDIVEKIKTLSAAAEGAVFGGIGQKGGEGTVMVTAGATKPMLGRYEIIKELGRGAMGIVYLGKDPKINRQVAIKTLMLEEGGTPEETKQIKERFFREAESAGTLNHPNIVRIYDAGEEQDICYIAMELLDGHDLTRYCGKENRLDALTAMEYVARVAEGLDYAHNQGIIHRDIKPANIMLLNDGSVRVADFGIARIAASSKTATGTVMGTPSYMSPEQIAGRKVDGRSDLFSLGVTLFELLTGEKPFKGGDGIGTLLFQIANEPEPEPLQIEPKLPRRVSAIVHKALKKNADERHQKGSELAAQLRACIEAVKSGAGDEAQTEEVTAAAVVPIVEAAPVVEPAAVEAPVPVVEAVPEPVVEASVSESTIVESPVPEPAATFEIPVPVQETAAVDAPVSEAAVMSAPVQESTFVEAPAPEPTVVEAPAPEPQIHLQPFDVPADSEHTIVLELPPVPAASAEPAAAPAPQPESGAEHHFTFETDPIPPPSAEIELGPRPGGGLVRPRTPGEIAAALPGEPPASAAPEEPLDPDATIRLDPPGRSA
ncbi:MAG: CHASE2 domain-containing protein [Elusimicrobiota bacterium]|jgi:serine/threonine-protein kinase